MVRNKTIEFIVGLFMLAGLIGLVLLAFKVSGLSNVGNNHYYQVSAEFDNIGSLRVRAPVSISGVAIGRVSSIEVDPLTFRAKVILQINDNVNKLPEDTSASILTQGLLGSNYISLTPGFSEQSLKAGSMIQTTHSALVLENLVGQLMYNLKNDKGADNQATKAEPVQ